MKRQLLYISMITIVFALAANTQTLSYPLEAEVPFEFMVGEKKMPAGRYSVQTALPNIIRIATDDKRASSFLNVIVANRPLTDVGSKLVFNRYGDQYFLSAVWSERSERGLAARPTKFERELIANNGPPQTRIVIAGRK